MFNERLAEFERLLNRLKRESKQPAQQAPPQPVIPPAPQGMYSATGPQPQPFAPNVYATQGTMQNPPSWMSVPGVSATPYGFPATTPGVHTRPYTAPAPMLYPPPPPPYLDDTFKDFSQLPQQEYLAHEARLYQRINYNAKVRLGYGKAVAVLHRHLEDLPEYERIIRPYQIDQPEDLPALSPLIPNSEARLFADTVRGLVDIIGLQRSVHILENAKVNEVPGIHYEIQRVMVPASPTPVPLEPEIISSPIKMSDAGPFARSRTNSMTSIASSLPTMYSWNDMAMSIPPPPAPPSSLSSMVVDEIPLPPPPMSNPPNRHRSILRRSSSGSLNKRVTIQTEPDCVCTDHCHSPFIDGPHVMSPISMSPGPLKIEDRPSSDESADYHSSPPPMNPAQDRRPMRRPEEDVLQRMAAAQM